MKFYKLDHEATMEDVEKLNCPNSKLGVIVHIKDKAGKILCQQRGVKSRDDNGLFEDIGGKLESSDKNFKSAIIRELKEEVGDEANIEIGNSIGIYHRHNNNWIFIIYLGKYIDGDLKIMEPEKCMGYKFFSYEEALSSNLVTNSCKFLIEELKEYK